MTTETPQQAIGRLRGEIRRYLCNEVPLQVLEATLRGVGLNIELTPDGYRFRVPCSKTLNPAQEESVMALPKLYAVDPPQRLPDAILVAGCDVECLPGILTELSSVGLIFHSA